MLNKYTDNGYTMSRRTTLLIGIAIFTLGNILTAIAPSLFFMIIARFIVGIGSAAIAPVVVNSIKFLAAVYFASNDSDYTTEHILTVSDGFGLATPVYGELSDKLNRR